MLIYEKSDVKLTTQEVRYWKRIFKSNLKIGVEIETNLHSRQNQSAVISALKTLLQPTENVSRFGKTGTYIVKGDGSLNNGVELCTVGRRIDFIDLYSQYKGICEAIFEHTPVMNSRAGLHNHVLLDYGNNYSSIEKPVPGLIMKNFIQLFRRHLPELVWITSTCNGSGNIITRRDNFCKSESMINFTPINRTISTFRNNATGRDRYQFMNMAPFESSEDDITKLHFELRFPDGSIWPAQIAAQNVLYAAFFQKAIEISENGLINTGTKEEWLETKSLFRAIRNSGNSGLGDNRESVPAEQEELDIIKERGFNMLKMLKPNLDQYDKHVYLILKFLNEKPISILRRDHLDAQINVLYNETIKSMYNVDVSDCQNLIKVINTQSLCNIPTKDIWELNAAEKLSCKKIDIQNKLFKLSQVKDIGFDSELGTYVFR